jgi:preprotein translocase subunit SecA
MFESCMEKIATLTALRILNIRITLPNGVTVSPDQLQLKSQEQIDAERKAAEEAAAAAGNAGEANASESADAQPSQESSEQLSADGAKAAGLAGQAASSETNALSEDQQAQPMPQSALPGTRPNRAAANAALAAAVKRAQQQAGAKLGRNDLCWCGSGLKYKKCHGKDVE